jgi:hypothetical protein
MPVEGMSSDERVWAAIRLERPDRVPIIPTLLPEPAAGLSGLTQAEVAADSAAAVRAVFRVFDEYGGWDNPYPASYRPIQLQASGVFPVRMRIPGRDLDENTPFQVDEAEVLQRGDYHTIAETGFERFFNEDFLWRITDLERQELPGVLEEMVAGGMLFVEECARRERKPFFLASALHPFFTLSLMRSMVSFTRDLFYDPEPVERALARMTSDLIHSQLAMVKLTGIALWLCTEERAGGYFFPLEIFERFWWPYTKAMVEAMWDEGIVTLFHLDTCWEKNLAYFRELPKGSAVLELDSTTDLFAASEALGGHLCLKGDLPAALFSIGTPDEVEAYCRRRIAEVGRDGGYILGSGCSVPADARPENFRRMIDSAKRF